MVATSFKRHMTSGAAVLLGLGTALTASPALAGAANAGPAGQTVKIVAHRTAINTNQSNNWSGYNIGNQYPGEPTGTTFKSISGEWVVPKATQHKKGQVEDSASWIGIGGGCVNDTCSVTDNTLIQAGTEQDVAASGATSYDAWYELIPETETKVSLVVHPGDLVQVSITEGTATQWKILIDNLTTKQSYSSTQTYSSSMDTAEWIEETPLVIGTGGTGLANMPNLTRVHFKSASLNGANPKFATVDEMQLSNNGAILATPSAPNPAKNAFNDCTYATGCPAP